MEPQWRIEMLGGLRAQRDGQCLTRFRTQKTGLLLAYLAYHLRRSSPREALVDLLWPESEPHVGRGNLSRELSWLRDHLEPAGVPPGAVLLADRSLVSLNPAAVSCDVGDFEAALHAATRAESSTARIQALACAVELYHGSLLAGYYDNWILTEQERLAERYFEALARLLLSLEQAGDLQRAVDYARQGVAADPLREEAHRNLMRLLAATGESGAALLQYRELERLLKQELGVEPDTETRSLARSLEQETRERGRNSVVQRPGLESVGGAVPLDSAFYVIRPADAEFRAAIASGDSIVLVKGSREMGKTSLLARGLQQARRARARIVLTDFAALSATDLSSAEAFLLSQAEWMALQLELDVAPRENWREGCGPGINFQHYLQRHVLGKGTEPIVWGLDGVDRLFLCDFGSELFGLFRSWHNARSLDPTGPWGRLTLAITYATEAHLFIRDPRQSPFNVGTRVALDDFTLEQVASLNRRYGRTLKSDPELVRFYQWVGGHPYLVRRAFHEMATRRTELATLEEQAERATGIYADHLRQLLLSLEQAPDLCDAMRCLLRGEGRLTTESFYRLRSAGVIVGETPNDARPRCRLYATHLERTLL